MIEFELEDEWDGWSGIAIPDDMTVNIRTENENDIVVSLIDLLELYGFIVQRKSCEHMVGTGTMVEISHEDDQVRFRTAQIESQTTFEELSDSFDQLFQQVFAEKDERESASEREDSLQYAAESLRNEGVEYDVSALYHRLINDRT